MHVIHMHIIHLVVYRISFMSIALKVISNANMYIHVKGISSKYIGMINQ